VFVLPGRDEPVPCCVVDFLDLDRCQVVDGFVWPLVVEPVDTVHRLELGGRVPPEESPCRLQDLVSPTQLGTDGSACLSPTPARRTIHGQSWTPPLQLTAISLLPGGNKADCS
jgi:hypothetical protein